MKVIDGKALADSIRAELKEKIAKSKRIPGLAVVIVGEDPASKIYVRNKIKACNEMGIRSMSYEFPADISQNELENFLDSLANNLMVLLWEDI